MNPKVLQSVLPIVQVATCVGASVMYLWTGDRPRAAYWFLAACLTGSTLVIK